MKCPGCGDKDAKQVVLFTGISYLCVSSPCNYFDHDHAVAICAKAFEGLRTEAPEEEPLLLPDDQGFVYD